MCLGQYDGIGEYCGPHTVSSVFLILLVQTNICMVAAVRTSVEDLGGLMLMMPLTNFLCAFKQASSIKDKNIKRY